MATPRQAGWPWDVALAFNPDKPLAKSEHIVATADSVILKRCSRWLNLVRLIAERRIPRPISSN
jgi:hypothetical protein